MKKINNIILLFLLLIGGVIGIAGANQIGNGFFISIPSSLPISYVMNLDNRYIIEFYSLKLSSPDNGNWSFEGSNDNVIYNLLDIQNFTFSAGENKIMIINNTNSYQYYKLTLNSGFSYGESLEIHIYNSIPEKTSMDNIITFLDKIKFEILGIALIIIAIMLSPFAGLITFLICIIDGSIFIQNNDPIYGIFAYLIAIMGILVFKFRGEK